MKQWSVRILVGFLGGAFACGAVLARLPAPEPSQDAKAAATAAKAKAKAAWSSKVGAYKLCLAQEKAVAHYMAGAQSAGKAVTPATPTPACTDPGPYVVAAVEPAQSAEAVKAAAAAAAAKAAWSSKVGAYKLCVAQDKAVAHYTASAQSAGKAAAPAAPTPACADPGPYVVTAVEPTKPVEAAGAHSPAATAISPPSTKLPDAAVKPVEAAGAHSPMAAAISPPGTKLPDAVVKPVEAAGAHSPAATAIRPPSTQQSDAAVNPAVKP